MAIEIKLPALKENVETVEINAVKVAVGDVVAKDQALLEVVADKAAMEVTAPAAGRVSKLLVKPGDEVKVGQVYAVLEGGNGAVAAEPGAPTAKPKAEAAPAKPVVAALAPAAPPVASAPSQAGPLAAGLNDGAAGAIAHAGPATRRLARELGVDLGQVTGTGRYGRVTEEDVKGFVRRFSASGLAPPAPGPGVVAPSLPRFEEWGPVERQKLSMIRKATARQMSLAWSLIPHVTQHDEADITELEAFRKQQQGQGVKLTVTAFALKAAAIMLKRFEPFNASLDSAAGQLILKRYCHIGVAVDTPAGLVVPVIRDVDRKSVAALAAEMAAAAERARGGKLDAKEMQGGCFTITNLGGIGGTAFTPIVNHPEVAILGLSRARLLPMVSDGAMTPRLMLPLSLSYDHRVIDGAAAARFTHQLAELLENPLLIALHA